MARRCPRQLPVTGGSTDFDHDIDVVDPLQQLRWQECDGLADKPAELRAFQGATVSRGKRPRVS